MSSTYDRWQRELAGQKAERQDIDSEIDGFYRAKAATTKPDYPVAIWTENGLTYVNIGNAPTFSTEGEATKWWEFIGGTWLWCEAVTEADYHAARDTGYWSDSKPARKISAEQKADIIPNTPAEQGGNMSDDEALTYDQQIDAKMKIEIKRRAALGKIDTLEKANAAADILDKIMNLGKLGNARREADRAPHLAAAQAIQNTWLAVLTPGSDLVKPIKSDINAFQDAEQARLQAIADAEALAARQAREAEAEAIRAENQRMAELAAEKGAPEPEPIPEPVIVDEPAPVVAAPKVAAAYGRAVTTAKFKKGRITDYDAFINAIKSGEDFQTWLQTKANALARAKMVVAGLEIYQE